MSTLRQESESFREYVLQFKKDKLTVIDPKDDLVKAEEFINTDETITGLLEFRQKQDKLSF